MTHWQGIIFDKDGTLFEFAATWEAWAQAFLLRITEGNRDEAARIGQTIGFDFASRSFLPNSVVIAGTPQEIAQALAPEFPDLSDHDMLEMLNEEAAMAPQIEAVSLIPFLDGLKAQGLKLGIATNDAEAPALAHLRSAGVEGRFDFIAGFDSGFGAKPSDGQLKGFCAQTGCAPDRVLMVGDSTHDLMAGASAGMCCIGVLTGIAPREVLEPFADVVLPDIGHIPEWMATS